jgi:hypothetical protein
VHIDEAVMTREVSRGPADASAGGGARNVWPPDRQIEFHLKEVEALRAEIARLDAAKRTLQLYTIAGVAGVAAWLFTNRVAMTSSELRLAWLLPVFLATMGFRLSRSYVRSAKEIGAYIARLEEHAALPDLGWETSLARRRKTVGSLISRAETLNWLIVFLLTLLAAAYFGFPRLLQF